MTVNRVHRSSQKKPSVAIAAYEDFAPAQNERFLLYIYIYTICNAGLTNHRYALTCAADITHKDRQDRRSVKNRTLGSVFIVAGTTIGAACWQCRWLRQVLVLASR